jgi:hypothetical protein
MRLLRILELEDKQKTRKLLIRWKRIGLAVAAIGFIHLFWHLPGEPLFWVGLIAGIAEGIHVAERTAQAIERDLGKTIAVLQARLEAYDSAQC